MSEEAAVEAYSYVNIFETKGIEYLLVVAFLTGFVLFVRALRVHRPLAVTSRPEATARPVPICFSIRECPHKQVFTRGLGLATAANFGRQAGAVPSLCTCPDLTLVAGQPPFVPDGFTSAAMGSQRV